MTAVIVDADDINREHQLARRHANDAIKHAIRCGELLIQKKAELPHGTFTSWIVANCKFKQATANNYMRAAQNPNALGNSIRHLFPSGRPGAAAAIAATKVAEPDYLKQAADMMGVPLEMARRAQTILHRDPVLADKITAGSITLDDAEKIIEDKEAEVPEEKQVEVPEEVEEVPTSNLEAFQSWQRARTTGVTGADRVADLDRVKSIITEYANSYGWGAAQMDLVEWIEGQA